MSVAGFVVLYRWRLRPGSEDAFVQAWSQRTEALLQVGSLGSRLHRGDDDLWYSYAQWPSDEVRHAAFERVLQGDEARREEAARRAMDDAILEVLPEIILAPQADYLD